MKNKDFRPILRALRDQGWSVEETSSGHWKAVPPDPTKGMVHFNDGLRARSLKNALGDLRSHGFLWPPPPRAPNSAPLSAEDQAMLDALAAAEAEEEEADDPHASEEARIDELFFALRDAKMTHSIAAELLRGCEDKLRLAQEERDKAAAECAMAAKDVQTKKAAFDKVFEVSDSAMPSGRRVA